MPYCPNCRAEFVETTSVCPDCEVPLEAGPPPEDSDGDAERETPQWETVLETGNPALLAATKSVLQGAGVPFVVTGEGLQSLEGWGVIGTGFNPIFGPARVQVPPDRAAEARALLSEEARLTADPGSLPPAAAPEDPASDRPAGGARGRRGGGFAQGAAVGLLLGIVAGLAIAASGKLAPGQEAADRNGTSTMDSDGDGRPDNWVRYEDGVMRSIAYDTNHDGERDSWLDLDRSSRRTASRTDLNYDGDPDSSTRYENGRAVATEEDLDFDGEIDLWTDLGEGEIPTAQRDDTDGDGEPDAWYVFDDDGLVVTGRLDANFDGTPDDLDEYDAGELIRSRRDADFDGTHDVTITYRNQYRETMTWEARPGAPARELTYRHGMLREELRDRDGDGVWDLRIAYDPFEHPVEEVELPRGDGAAPATGPRAP